MNLSVKLYTRAGYRETHTKKHSNKNRKNPRMTTEQMVKAQLILQYLDQIVQTREDKSKRET